MDPHTVLGLDPGASPEEVHRAYRALAKRFHPDHAGDQGGELMVSINAAYDLLRDELATGLPRQAAAPARRTAAEGEEDGVPARVRRVLARELLAVLERGEQVEHVVLTSTTDSHDVQLAVTDRRLLWLRDDAITARVRYVRYRDVDRFESRGRRRFRRGGELLVHTRAGRRLRFFDLRPELLARLIPALACRAAG